MASDDNHCNGVCQNLFTQLLVQGPSKCVTLDKGPTCPCLSAALTVRAIFSKTAMWCSATRCGNVRNVYDCETLLYLLCDVHAVCLDFSYIFIKFPFFGWY